MAYIIIYCVFFPARCIICFYHFVLWCLLSVELKKTIVIWTFCGNYPLLNKVVSCDNETKRQQIVWTEIRAPTIMSYFTMTCVFHNEQRWTQMKNKTKYRKRMRTDYTIDNRDTLITRNMFVHDPRFYDMAIVANIMRGWWWCVTTTWICF